MRRVGGRPSDLGDHRSACSDQHGNRVEVAGVAFKAEALRFEGVEPPPENGSRIGGGLPPQLLRDLGAGRLEHVLVVGFAHCQSGG